MSKCGRGEEQSFSAHQPTNQLSSFTMIGRRPNQPNNQLSNYVEAVENCWPITSGWTYNLPSQPLAKMPTFGFNMHIQHSECQTPYDRRSLEKDSGYCITEAFYWHVKCLQIADSQHTTLASLAFSSAQSTFAWFSEYLERNLCPKPWFSSVYIESMNHI